MRHQARKPLALTLGALLLAAVPAQAGPVEYRDVVSHSAASGRSGGPSVDLRLRSYTQQQGKSASRPDTVAAAGPAQDQKAGGPSSSGEGSATAAPNTSTPLTGAVVLPQDQQTTVETIELGEVDGTLCDCGEIKIPGGGFPLWPLLGFAGIPLFFIPEDDDIIPTPTPTPPSTPTPEIPEPTTLLLFGTGLAALGAGARRRRARQAKLQQVAREV